MATPVSKAQQDSVRAFYDQALKFKNAHDYDEAERICRRAQAIYRREPNIICLLGEILLRQRQPQEAESWFDRALTSFPGNPRALEGKGRALVDQRKPRRAVKFLKQAAEAVPNRYSTHLALGRALAMTGQNDRARESIDRALALNPAKAVIAQSSDALQEGDKTKAEKILRGHLAQHPDDPVAIRLLGLIAIESNRGRAAVRLLKKVVELAPDFQMAWNDLATALMKRDRFDEALECIDKAIELDSTLPHAHLVRGNILAKAQRHEDALSAYQQVIEMSPGHPGGLAGQGHVLKTIGRQQESIATYRECIRSNPAFGEAYWSLANLKTFEFAAGEVAVMEEMVAEENLPEEPLVNFLYSLGKHFENVKEFDRAFDFYTRGAAIRRAQEQYDPVHMQVLHDRIIEVFSPEFLAERQGWGDPDGAPILVVGLPRSGSTLIEQILASHSQVEGTQELPDLGRCVGKINRHGKKGVMYPEALREMKQDDLRFLGRKYIDDTQRYRTGLSHFIDKMPNNFPSIGLLHLMLPNAKVIDARRHPLDSCLGSWKQLFFNGQAFTYDWFELGQYYLQYRRVMDHWHQVLPGKVLEVRYEDVVTDLEGQTRRILEYCELPFEEQCLRFYETQRAVNTASSEQVRKPIYTSSVNFWRNYEPFLGELIDQLEPLLLGLPAEDRPYSLRG